MPATIGPGELLDLDGIAPSSRQRALLRLDVHETGTVLETPVHVLAGRRGRPRLAVVGGVHGDEYDGILAAQKVLRETDPGTLDGTLVVIPVANPSAFGAGQRITPIDGVDLNRVFPGRPDGGVTERQAHLLFHSVLRHMDLVFTLHGARSPSMLAPWLEFFDAPGAAGSASYEAACAAGFPDLIAVAPKPGVLLPTLGQAGVPVIEGEVGGRGEAHEANVAFYVDRVRDVMRHAGLLAGKADSRAVPPTWRNNDVTAPAPGILLRVVELRAAVRAGQTLGCILDREGAEVAEIRAPVDGVVGAIRVHAGIRPGDIAFRIWTPTGAPEAG